MPGPYYYKSTAAGTNTGADWTNAFTTLTAAKNAAVAGDTVYISHLSAEALTATTTYTWAGTVANPVKLICVDDTALPPTTLATTATLSLTGAGFRIEFGGSVHVYGLSLINNGTGSAGIWLCNGVCRQVWEEGSLQINSTSSATLFVSATSASPYDIEWRNMSIKLGAAGSVIATNAGRFRWEGGGVVSGSATPTGLFTTIRNVEAEVTGVDFSNFGAGFNLLTAGSTGKMKARNIRVPTTWTGGLHNGNMTSPGSAELHNYDFGASGNHIRKKNTLGEMRDDEAIYMTGGAAIGAVPFSWKIDTNANASYPANGFETMELPAIQVTAGVPITITVPFIHDSVTALTDADIQLEVWGAVSGSPLLSYVRDAKAGLLATAANQAASTAAWVGTGGFANPNKQQLSVALTPAVTGMLQGRIVVYKTGNYTLYANPQMKVS